MSDFVHLKLPSPWATEADLRDEVDKARAEAERADRIRRQNDTRLTRERDAWKGAHAGAVRALKALRAEARVSLLVFGRQDEVSQAIGYAGALDRIAKGRLR